MRSATLCSLGLFVSWMLGGCAGGGTSTGDAGPADAGSDGPEDSGSPDAADCGTLAWKSPSCASCTQASCCAVEAICAAIPTCAPLDACWSACGADAGCTNACGAQYIDAISNYNAILNCQHNSCATECASE